MNRFYPFLVPVLLICFSCGSAPQPGAENKTSVNQDEPRVLIRSEPETKPEWVHTTPKSDTEFFFIGISRYYSTAADARNEARNDAFNQILRFYGEFIQSTAVERTSFSGASAETINAMISYEEEIASFAQGIVSQVGADRYFTEVYLGEKNREEYLVYVLCQIPRQKAEEDIRNFAKNTSERYANLLSAQDDLYSVIRTYGDMLEALENNPLHRAVAYYDSPGGRVQLYNYLYQQLGAIASSVSFVPLPDMSVQKTDVIDTSVQLNSARVRNLGPLECTAAVYGMNNPSPTVVYTINAGSSFPLKILTQKLNPGRYTVRLELLLNRVSRHVSTNPVGGFSFEVFPAAAEIEYRGTDLSNEEKETLLRSVQQGLQNNLVPVRLGASSVETRNRYGFVVTVNAAKPSVAPSADLVQYEVTLSFVCNGTVIKQSETKRIPEINRNYAFNNPIAAFIRNNEVFFRGVKESLE